MKIELAFPGQISGLPGSPESHPSIDSVTIVGLEHLFASWIDCFLSSGQSEPQKLSIALCKTSPFHPNK